MHKEMQGEMSKTDLQAVAAGTRKAATSEKPIL